MKIYFVTSNPHGLDCIEKVGGELLVSFYFLKGGSTKFKDKVDRFCAFQKGEKYVKKRTKIEKEV